MYIRRFWLRRIKRAEIAYITFEKSIRKMVLKTFFECCIRCSCLFGFFLLFFSYVLLGSEKSLSTCRSRATVNIPLSPHKHDAYSTICCCCCCCCNGLTSELASHQIPKWICSKYGANMQKRFECQEQHTSENENKQSKPNWIIRRRSRKCTNKIEIPRKRRRKDIV